MGRVKNNFDGIFQKGGGGVSHSSKIIIFLPIKFPSLRNFIVESFSSQKISLLPLYIKNQNALILNNTLSLNSLGNETFTFQENVRYNFISFSLLSQFNISHKLLNRFT